VIQRGEKNIGYEYNTKKKGKVREKGNLNQVLGILSVREKADKKEAQEKGIKKASLFSSWSGSMLSLLLGIVLLQGIVDCTVYKVPHQEGVDWNIKESSAYKLFSKLDVTKDGSLQWGEWKESVLIKVETGHGESERDISHVCFTFSCYFVLFFVLL
jgi:hypothetical protein